MAYPLRNVLETLNAAKEMNPNQKEIPIAELGEVKFEPAVLRSKTSLKPITRHREGHRADMIQTRFPRLGVEDPAGWFGRSEFVRTTCPILPATPATFAEERRKRHVRKSEMQSRI